MLPSVSHFLNNEMSNDNQKPRNSLGLFDQPELNNSLMEDLLLGNSGATNDSFSDINNLKQQTPFKPDVNQQNSPLLGLLDSSTTTGNAFFVWIFRSPENFR